MALNGLLILFPLLAFFTANALLYLVPIKAPFLSLLDRLKKS